MINLPVWVAGLLAFFYVLGTFLSGLGAMWAGRGNKKTQEIGVIINGRLDQRIEEAYRRGLAEGKLEATGVIAAAVVGSHESAEAAQA